MTPSAAKMKRTNFVTELKRRFPPDMRTIRRAQSKRTLLLNELNSDLQMGVVVQEIPERSFGERVIDIGVRIPSVENLIDEYEVDCMIEMGFRDPEPIGWLTFYRTLDIPSDLDGSSNIASYIASEFNLLHDTVSVNLDSSSDYFRSLLCRGQRPEWATMFSSSLLLIRILACCPAERSNLTNLLRKENMAGEPPQNVKKFVDWLLRHMD